MEGLFRNTLGAGGWFVLGLIPPAIFAIYFLKLKRQPFEVPSTFLWNRVIEDLHVNSLWQRLRKSLLLFLQLLLIALAILALLRPGWQGESLLGQRYIFLIDRSASMSATDGLQGGSRLMEAKQRVAALIDQLESDMSAMIIAFDQQPNVVQEFTNNKRLLRESLNRIEPSAGLTDLRGALELADGFANPARIMSEDGSKEFEVTEQQSVELYILSDGRFRGVEGFSLGNLQAKFLPIGSFASQNMAITTFNTRQGDERSDGLQAFVKVANYSEQDQSVVVELYLEKRLLDAAEIDIAAGEVAATTFRLAAASEGQLMAKLVFSANFKDELSLDNRSYAVLEDRRDARVLLVTPGNSVLEIALATKRIERMAKVEKVEPSIMAKDDFRIQIQSETYDLVIFDQCVPPVMPLANTLFIGRLPPQEDWSPSKLQPVPQIIDWQRSHPLFSMVEMGNVQIRDTLLARPPLGGRVLVDSTIGPLVAITPRDRYEDVVVGFEIVGQDEQGVSFNTDWPRKHSFPNFWFNVLEYFSRMQKSTHQHNLPESPVELRVSGALNNLDVRLPDGTRSPVEFASPGQVVFHDTKQLGIYKILGQDEKSKGERIVKSFAVNLFDPMESDIRLQVKQDGEDGVKRVHSLAIGYVDVQAELSPTSVRRE
ncbi:MAG: BatA and WFA domain-containing protein, partial [Pirellulales bacterium]|nr:BatA and WFA domain-containing protein [Pirellulales bacterium]